MALWPTLCPRDALHSHILAVDSAAVNATFVVRTYLRICHVFVPCESRRDRLFFYPREDALALNPTCHVVASQSVGLFIQVDLRLMCKHLRQMSALALILHFPKMDRAVASNLLSVSLTREGFRILSEPPPTEYPSHPGPNSHISFDKYMSFWLSPLHCESSATWIPRLIRSQSISCSPRTQIWRWPRSYLMRIVRTRPWRDASPQRRPTPIWKSRQIG